MLFLSCEAYLSSLKSTIQTKCIFFLWLSSFFPALLWVSVLFSCSQVVQCRPRGPRGLSGLSPSLSVWTSEVWTILSRRRCPSLCPSSSSLPVLLRPRIRSAAPTPRTGTLLCPSLTASSLKRHRPQVEKVRLMCMLSFWHIYIVTCVRFN